jgi:hypothetical protein
VGSLEGMMGLRVRRNLRLVPSRDRGKSMHKKMQSASKVDASQPMPAMSAPLDEKSSAWIMEYTWSPSDSTGPAMRPKLGRRK